MTKEKEKNVEKTEAAEKETNRVGKGKLIQSLLEKENCEKYNFEFDYSTTSAIVDSLFENIQRLVIEQGRLNIPKFGTFVRVETHARTARNPHSGEQIQVPPKKRVRFKPASDLMKRLNGVVEEKKEKKSK